MAGGSSSSVFGDDPDEVAKVLGIRLPGHAERYEGGVAGVEAGSSLFAMIDGYLVRISALVALGNSRCPSLSAAKM